MKLDKDRIAVAIKAKDYNANETSLVIRMKKNERSVYISTKSQITKIRDWAISYQLDNGPLKKERWGVSRRRLALFCPRSIFFIKELRASESLQVTIKDYRGVPRDYQFDLRGLDEAVQKLEGLIGVENDD